MKIKCLIVINTFVTTFASIFHGAQKVQNAANENNAVHPLPYFRRKVEGDVESVSQTPADDPQGHIVNFLVNNVKQIFNEDPPFNADVDNNVNLKDNLIDNVDNRVEKVSIRSERFSIKSIVTTTKDLRGQVARTSTPANEILATGPSVAPFDSVLQSELNETSYRFMFPSKYARKQLGEYAFPFSDKNTDKDLMRILYGEEETTLQKTNAYQDLFSMYEISTVIPVRNKINNKKVYNNKSITANSILTNTLKNMKIDDKINENANVTIKTLNFKTKYKTKSRASDVMLPFLRFQENIVTNKDRKTKTTTDVSTVATSHNSEDDNVTLAPVLYLTDTKIHSLDNKRLCIRCDNVANSHCSSPKNSILSSTSCTYDDPLCYSQHTPFGIVDRGCFSISHNLTIFVCACNLCNHISITDMPILFRNLKDWITNVYELTHLRRLNKSVFKEMSCLNCVVNMTRRQGNPVSNSDCLEGRVDRLPTQECKENQLCAVKAVKNQGYIWRGCVDRPLYNYYMTLCDSDLCNNDPIVSIYDDVSAATNIKKKP